MTIKEVAEKYAMNKYDNWNLHPDDHFLAGAEYQEKRMYSQEEVLKSTDYLGFKQITSEELNSLPYQPFITDGDGNIWIIDKNEWFKQFKKN